MAEAEVRLKFDGARPLPAKPKKMRTLGASQISILLRAALRGGMKGSNDHVSRLDYCPNLDHLE